MTSRIWNRNWGTRESAARPSAAAIKWSINDSGSKYLVAAMLLCLATQAILVFVQRANWDEYYYLALIHDFQRGELTKALQTFHVYPFFWLTRLSGDELWQVEVGRLCMLAMFAGSCWLTYVSARTFASRVASAFAVLAFISIPDVLIHGASFRADPMAAFLTMIGVAILIRSKLDYRWLLVAGGSLVIAMLVTIKIVFFAPTLLAFVAWRWLHSTERSAMIKRLSIVAAASAAAFGILYFLHQNAVGFDHLAVSQDMVNSAANTTIVKQDTLSRHFLLRQSYNAPVQVILLLLSIGTAALAGLGKRTEKSDRFLPLMMLALALPLFSLLFYRNAFPYFYPFILPSSMILVAWWIDRTGLRLKWLAVMAAIMTVAGLTSAWFGYYRNQDMQERVIRSVHDIFPEPVHYIDRNSMIASFPKRGIFMSTWGLTSYVEAGQPIYEEILAKDTVPLLLLNSQALKEAVGDEVTNEPIETLLEPDRTILQDNYIAHSGPIWVAGKQLKVGPAAQQANFAVPGRYTLEARSGILLDGQSVRPGAVVQINRGTRVLQSSQPQNITLRWGSRLHRPFIPLNGRGLYGKM